eukprot:PhM_4_TR3645/c0_g1_i1/m.61027/K17362/ACOT13; acyl-coenzyme A thioesterase 13
MIRIPIKKFVGDIGHFASHVIPNDTTIDADPRTCTRVNYRFPVTKHVLNGAGTLHGGATATLFDSLTAVHNHAYAKKKFVSVDLHVTYITSAKEGEELVLSSEIIKSGGRLAFVRAQLKEEYTGRVVATALHTQAVIAPPPVSKL